MTHEELSLENLTPSDLSPSLLKWTMARQNSCKLSYYEKYGREEGDRRFCMDAIERNRSTIRRSVNTRIYFTGEVNDPFNPEATRAEEEEFEARLREVYGDQYDELVLHRVKRDPRVAELLIQEAMRTGVWEELPKELQPEYRKRVEGDMPV